MKNHRKATAVCQICGIEKDLNEVRPGDLVMEGVQETIKATHPHWSPQGYICLADLNHFSGEYVRNVLEEEKGEISSLQEEVMESLKQHELISRDPSTEFPQKLTFWERLSDRVTAFGGSWFFVFFFCGLTVVWMAVNSLALVIRPFDPYPFIFLNLVFSLMSAIQAPVILMSQNRQDSRDRLRSIHDYRLNLKAELEIRHLNEKMDLLLTHQWHRLLEIQRIQLQVLEGLTGKS